MQAISKRSILLVIFDFLSLLVAFIFGYLFRVGPQNPPPAFIFFLCFSLFLFPVLFFIFDLYYPFKHFKTVQTFIEIIFSVSIGMGACAAMIYIDRSFILPRSTFVYSTLLLIPFIFVSRIFYDAVLGSRFLDRRVLIFGTGPLASEIAKSIRAIPHSGIDIIGFVYGGTKPAANSKMETPVLGSGAELSALIDRFKIHYVILALESGEEASQGKELSRLVKHRNAAVISAFYLFEKLEGLIPFTFFDSYYLLELGSRVKTRPYLRFKRFIDLVFATLLLIIMSPVFLLTILVLGFQGPGSIFFVQERIGKDRKPFQLIKFKSMTEIKRGKQNITEFGKWIRKYRIDEMPQLINVIKGDMSLIGPRPEIPYFVNRSLKRIPFYDVMFSVKPGLTGWAQVRFRHATSVKDYDKKFCYNLYYLKNISPTLDLVILLKTIRVVLLGAGK